MVNLFRNVANTIEQNMEEDKLGRELLVTLRYVQFVQFSVVIYIYIHRLF